MENRGREGMPNESSEKFDAILDRIRLALAELAPEATPSEIDGALVRLCIYLRVEQRASKAPHGRLPTVYDQ